MNRNFLVFFFVLYSVLHAPIVVSQTSTIIGNPGVNEHAFTAARDPLGNSYLGGASNKNGLITKVNSMGGVVWSQALNFNITGNENVNISHLEVLNDTLYGCGWISSGNVTLGTHYFKMNKNTGDFYWMKQERSSRMYFSSMRYDDGRYFLLGSKTGVFDTYDGKVVCVNSQNGELIWQTNALGLAMPPYYNDYIDDFAAMTSIVNGRFYVCGRSYVDGGSNYDMRPTLIGFDLNGNILCQKYLLYPSEEIGQQRMYGKTIEFDGSDSLVIAFLGDNTCSQSCDDFKVGLVKTDLDGNVSFSKTYDVLSSPNETVRALNVTDDAYVLFGSANYMAPDAQLMVIKTTKSGDFQKAVLLSKSGSALPATINTQNRGGSSDFTNGRHSFVASAHTGNPNDRDIVFVQLDEDLNGTSACLTSTPVYAQTSTIAPFSANFDIINKTNGVYPLSGSGCEPNVFDTSCAISDISYQQTVLNCDAVLVEISSISGTPYDISWDNGDVGPWSMFYSNSTAIIHFSNAAKCCEFYDTIPITMAVASPIVTLPSDTLVCLPIGGTFTISTSTAQCAGCTYLWNDGSTDASLSIDTAGQYSVVVTNNCGLQGTDSINVDVNFFPDYSAVSSLDTCLEVGNPVSLSVNAFHGDLEWWNGNTAPTQVVQQSGTYKYQVANDCGLEKDSIVLTYFSDPIQTLTDMDSCIDINTGVYLTLSTPGQLSNWIANGSDRIYITQSGTYYAVHSNVCGSIMDTCFVQLRENPHLVIDDTLNVCFDSLPFDLLGAANYPIRITHASGLPVEGHAITTGGDYIAAITGPCGSMSTSFYVNFILNYTLYAPNSFTPNNDKVNDRYTFSGLDYNLREVTIYDRWGEVVFTQLDGFDGWDGTNSGKDCQSGTYVVKIIYTSCENINQEKYLHVNLLR